MASEFAPGIPASRKVQRLPTVSKPRRWQLALQVHQAQRAGRHFDLRLADPQTRRAHSWALRRWPGPGQRVLAVQQPTHKMSYLGFTGRIAQGYGAGTVGLARREPVEILEADDNHVRFNAYPGQRVHEFLLKRTSGKNWLLINATPTRARKSVPDYKPKYKEKPYDQLDVSDPKIVVQAKMSGAHVLVDMTGDRPRVYSYRQGKRLIQHTPKIPGMPSVVPKNLKGSMFRAELVVPGIPEQQTGGLLNSGVWKSREQQKDKGKLRLYLFDVVRWRGKDVESLPYGQKMPLLDEALREPWLHRPRTAFTAGAKAGLMARIAAGREKTTDEGVVAWHMDEKTPTKAKVKEEHDVYVRRVFSGKRKGMAGGFEFSTRPGGPVVGRVGTGFKHDLKKHMIENPGLYEGLKAKIRAQRGGGGYAPQKPVFEGWHLDQQLPEGVRF